MAIQKGKAMSAVGLQAPGMYVYIKAPFDDRGWPPPLIMYAYIQAHQSDTRPRTSGVSCFRCAKNRTESKGEGAMTQFSK